MEQSMPESEPEPEPEPEVSPSKLGILPAYVAVTDNPEIAELEPVGSQRISFTETDDTAEENIGTTSITKIESERPQKISFGEDTIETIERIESGPGSDSPGPRSYSLVSSFYDTEEEVDEGGGGGSEDDAELLLAALKRERGGCRLPSPNINQYLPKIKQFSSMPDFIFYIANYINCVCGVYMCATGLVGDGFENSVRSILIHEEYQDDRTSLGSLGVAIRGEIISVMSFLMYTLSILGSIGIYYAIRPFIYINLGAYAIISLVQLMISLSMITLAPSCAEYQGMREPLLRHLEEYYTDSQSVSGEELYQDHSERINDMQEAISCCGLNSAQDYINLPSAPNPFIPPHSCCKNEWKHNIICNVDPTAEGMANKLSNEGCEQRVNNICFTIMTYLSAGGFIFGILLVVALFVSWICTLYHIRIQKGMAMSEVVYVERLNLFMPEIVEDDEDNDAEPSDDPTERRLLADTDKIKLSEKVSGFVDQVRKEYGMDDMARKKRIVVKKKKVDKIILAPFEMKMAEKRKFSMVAGRHNYFLNRQMLKYAAHIVTNKEGDEAYQESKAKILADKMKEVRDAAKKEHDLNAAAVHARAPTSQLAPTWKFKAPKKIPPVPEYMVKYHMSTVEAKLDKKKARDKARAEKQVQDEADEKEKAERRKHDVLNRLLSPRMN